MNDERKNYEWCFGLEEDEQFSGANSEEEAMTEGNLHAKDCGQDYFYIGKAEPISLEGMYYLSADAIVEGVTGNEENFEHLTEDAAEEWLTKLTPEQEEDLELSVKETIIAWIRRHKKEPRCFKVIETRRIQVSDD